MFVLFYYYTKTQFMVQILIEHGQTCKVGVRTTTLLNLSKQLCHILITQHSTHKFMKYLLFTNTH